MRLEQEASEELIRQARERGETIKSGLKKAGSLALTAAGPVALKGLQKVLPFLNESLPIELAAKGLSKFSPKVKKFLSEASIGGYTAKDAIDFLREKTTQQQTEISENEKKLEAFKKFKEHQKKTGLAEEEMKRFGTHYTPEKRKATEKLKQREEQILQKSQQLREENERQKIQGSKQGQQQQGVGQAALMQILQQINSRLG